MRSIVPIHVARAVRGFAAAGLLAGLMPAADSPRGLGAEVEAGVDVFNPAQVEIVRRWIGEDAPGCPPEAAEAAALKFLEAVQQREPGLLERIPAPDFPRGAYRSTLLRLVGAQLGGGSHTALREEVARRRLQAVLGQDGGGAEADAARLLVKIRGLSEVYHRRLVEGRTEDDDLRLLLRKVRQAEPGAKAETAVTPKTLSAAEIVSNFTRQNQEGSAVTRLRAYALEGRLTPPAGEEQGVLLYRLRPDRFRLALVGAEGTKHVLAFDGERHWQQAPGRAPAFLRGEAVGRQRYLAEFIDGLFGEAGARFERLEDGAVQGRPVFRIAVVRKDGSRYVARIDQESYRQVGRENEDKSTATYSDFREVAGIMIAFHEEVTDAEGRTSVLKLTRLTANPGLLQAFFDPPPAAAPLDFFALDRLVRTPAPALLK